MRVVFEMPVRRGVNAIAAVGIVAVVAVVAVVGMAVVGCGPQPAAKNVGGAENQPPKAGAHAHAHAASHEGGMMLELGDHVAFVEIVPSADEGVLTLYFSDGHDTPIRLKQESIRVDITPPTGGPLTLELAAQADPDVTGETVGDTAKFRAAHNGLKGLAEFRGRFHIIAVRGQTFENVEFAYPKK